jgi:hypothetical protein
MYWKIGAYFLLILIPNRKFQRDFASKSMICDFRGNYFRKFIWNSYQTPGIISLSNFFERLIANARYTQTFWITFNMNKTWHEDVLVTFQYEQFTHGIPGVRGGCGGSFLFP